MLTDSDVANHTLTTMTTLEVFLAALLGGIASKLVSLAIDGLFWFRSWAVALVGEAGKSRKRCK